MYRQFMLNFGPSELDPFFQYALSEEMAELKTRNTWHSPPLLMLRIA